MLRAFLLSGVLLSLGCGGDASPAPADGGGTDSGASDAATVDGSAVDGSAVDGSAMDGSAVDGSAVDSGDSDAATTDAGTSDAGATDAGSDAAIAWPDGCASPEPAWADLTVGEPGTCPAFTACGGVIVGAWDLSGGCFEIAIQDAISSCPGAMVTREVGRGRGCVDFGADGIAHRMAESQVDIDLFVPALCAGFVSCPSIESQIRARGLDASCPADAAGNCQCAVHSTTHIDDTDGYTTASNEIIGTVSGKHWEYCVAGTQMNYRDTSPSGAREPGIIELTQR